MKIITTVALTSVLAFNVLAGDPAPIVGGAVLSESKSVTGVVASGYSASDLLKADIYNDAGEKIGHVKDFIVDENSKASLVIISVGGFIGLGEKNIAIPSDLFTRNDKGQFVLPKASKEDLKALPPFQYAK